MKERRLRSHPWHLHLYHRRLDQLSSCRTQRLPRLLRPPPRPVRRARRERDTDPQVFCFFAELVWDRCLSTMAGTALLQPVGLSAADHLGWPR